MGQDRRAKRWLPGVGMVIALVAAPVASAAPWLESGKLQLRSDLELLAAHRLINPLVTEWPVPRGQLLALDEDALRAQPLYVQVAARRVQAALSDDEFSQTVDARFASRPAVVRRFDTVARDEADIRAGLQWNGETIGGALRVGALYDEPDRDLDATLDGSYLTALLGNIRIYGGWVERWDGPGWTSSLILSNNARPFPKIGLMREDPRPAESRWLSWLGPWQANFLLGYLDDDRIDDDTAFGSLRLSISPLPGLELTAMRSVEFCGKGHECKPLDAAFHLNNDDRSTNSTNDEATLEIKYTGVHRGITVSPYFQMMNEDTGPFTHSYTSHLGGLSLAGPWRDRGAHWRATLEYVDTAATYNAFDFSRHFHGIAYGNAGYPDGFRYRGRTLGFSLDSDSKLASLDLRFFDEAGRSYSLTAFRARISSPELAAIQASGESPYQYNVVSAASRAFNEIDAGVSVPLSFMTIDLIVRARSKALPDHLGDRVDGELGFSFRF